MNELKKYAIEKLKNKYGIKYNRTSNDTSFYRTIQSREDVEKQIKYVENMIKSYESTDSQGYTADVDARKQALDRLFLAIKKSVNCLSDISISHTDFDLLTKEQFDGWLERYDELNKRSGALDMKYYCRPDGE